VDDTCGHRLKIAFAAISDLADVRRGSGTFFWLAKELERQGHTVARVGPVVFDVPLPARFVHAVHRRLGRRHPLFLDPMVGKRTGLSIARQLGDLDYDVLLTNDMSIAAYTPTQKPVVIYTDVMITAEYAEKHLPGCRLGNLSPVSLALCRRTLRSALSRCALSVFPADWSAHAARAYWPAARISVIPFGANIDDPGPEIASARSWRAVMEKRAIDLLFVGKDWLRKGGDVAVEAAARLNAIGLNATLHVVGADLPASAFRAFVRSYGLLDKSKPEDLARLRALFASADVFILPSSSEGSVISVVEAAAYGLPTVAYDADGVKGVVLDQQSGRLFPLGTPGRVFAETIAEWQRQPAAYDALARGARGRYEATANWTTCVRRLTSEMRGLLPAG